VKPNSNYIPTLDGWRAIAIGFVIVSHAFLDRLPPVVGRAGPFGVAIFFAISGYLITTRMIGQTFSEFYIRRAFRILPPALLFLGTMAVLRLQGPLPGMLGCLFFFANYVPQGSLGFGVAHFWSLSMEEQFYLLWPSAFMLGKGRAKQGLLVVIAITVAWRFIALRVFPIAGVFDSQRSDLRLDAFLVPCFLALWLLAPENRTRLARWLSPGATVGLALASVVCCFGPKDVRYGLLALCLPLVVLSTVLHPEWAFSRLLETALPRWIGRISYSLYLWQQLFLLETRWPLALKVAALFLTAAASHYFLEKPLMRLGRSIAERRKQRVEPVAVGTA
jgi:peptidoglycan/LPS O-acetylase OafA/YrhL